MMVKVITYIFESDANNLIKKRLQNQERFNKIVSVFTLTMTAYAFLQDKRIVELSKEIEELRRTKGE